MKISGVHPSGSIRGGGAGFNLPLLLASLQPIGLLVTGVKPDSMACSGVVNYYFPKFRTGRRVSPIRSSIHFGGSINLSGVCCLRMLLLQTD